MAKNYEEILSTLFSIQFYENIHKFCFLTIVIYSIVRTFFFKLPEFRASTLMNICPYKGKLKEGQKMTKMVQ